MLANMHQLNYCRNMSNNSQRTVFLKSSGELLTGRPIESNERHLWTPDGVRNISEKVARAHRKRGELAVQGLVLVSGAGNIIRGEALRSEGLANRYADVLGRLATLQNCFVLSEAFTRLDVNCQIFIAPGTEFSDGTAGKLPVYSAENVSQAHEEGKIVLVAFGKGTDGNTTDEAVVYYAEDYAKAGHQVLILKGTKHDGIFDKDPAKHGDAVRYRHITPQRMRDLGLGGLDAQSLDALERSGLSMLVFADGNHDLVALLDDQSTEIGTVVSDLER